MLLTWSQKQIEYENFLYPFLSSECACVSSVCEEMRGDGMKFSLIAYCATRLIKLRSLFTPKSRQVNCWKLYNY